jgi:MtN3 and saliva related transmembrane protein
MYLSFCFGVFLWLCYGIVIRAWPLAINNGITLVLASSVLVMKWRFERLPRRAPASERPAAHDTGRFSAARD